MYSTGPKLTSGVEQTKPITWNVPCPATVVSGDVFLLGGRAPVVAFAQTDRDAAGYCSATFVASFVEKIPVTAAGHAGGSAVAIGDLLYLDGTTVNKDSTDGAAFGIALEAIDSGETANIWVAWVGYEIA
jgi:hypothetical protein